MQHRSKIVSALVPALAPALTAALAVSGVILHAAPAAACGGFFCSQTQPVNQAAERIIFADNGDGTVTAVIQILYEGPSENFSWLLPISSVPDAEGEIAVASDIAFQRLQAATNPQYNLTTRTEGTCRQQNFAGSPSQSVSGTAAPEANDAPSAGPGGVTVAASGVVGAFEWTALELDASLADPAAAALDWLTTNGYDVLPQSAELIGPYLLEGMYLLALRLTKGSNTGSIRPIVLTYDGSLPSIPIKLTAVAANDDMGVMTWMLSDARAVPYNYNALELNEARINWFNAAANYESVVTAAADDSGGQGFVTEFAGDSVDLRGVIWQDAEEAEWQSVRGRVYSSFGELFNDAYNHYSSFDGFWDSVRAAVTLPQGLAFEDFRSCPECYSDSVTLSPTTFFDAIEAGVIHPLRRVQELIDAQPYVTRLYSTLSAAEMTIDPVFTFNASLPTLSNIHTAERIIECNPNVYEFEASWRIELPQGGVIRGLAADVGSWPQQVDSQPANLRVLTLSDTGPGVVAEDNSEKINEMLASYNATVAASGSIIGGTGRPVGPSSPSFPNGSALPGDTRSESSSGCSLPGAGAPSGTGGRSGALAGFAALFALACSRMRRRRRVDGSTLDPS
jgi:hypothetical protein